MAKNSVRTYCDSNGWGWTTAKQAAKFVKRGIAQMVEGVCHFIGEAPAERRGPSVEATLRLRVIPQLDVVEVSPSKWEECWRTSEAAVAWPWLGDDRFPGRNGNRY